jgi:tetratricopeptide (TPR) repeat protein
VHAAHRLAEKFPDGQLFLDLHGYTQGYEPRTPGEALETFLRTLGVSAQQIPQDMDGRATLYRQRLADRRTLVLLDNAIDEAQVRPLLPGTAGCLVLVTSRKRLKALDDAHVLALDVLPVADAMTLLRTVAGPGRIPADDPLLREVAELCGRLPLALRIAATLLRHRRSWSLAHLADKLRVSQPELAGFFDGDRSLAAVFDLSHRALTDEQQWLLRHVGLIPGPDIDAYATAALIDTDPGTAERLLQDLVDHNLLAEPAPGRYQMHDLIRAHTHTPAAHHPADQTEAALGRLLDYYQHTAARADALIAPYPRPESAGPAPTYAPALPDPDTARAWLRAERPNLLAALHHTTTHARTITLTHVLASLLRIDGPLSQAIILHATAVTVAAHLGDHHAHATALADLGAARRVSGDYPGAAHDLREALEIYRALGDRRGQATALTDLAQARALSGELPGAAQDAREALEIYRALGDRRGQAHALTYLGQVRMLSGELPGAAQDAREALEIYRGLGDRRGQAHDLTYLGAVRRMSGDLPGASRDLREALEIYRALGARHGQALALTELGVVRRMSGDLPGAARDLRAALEIFREIGARGNQAWALNHYATVLGATGEHPQARTLHHEALDLARQTQQLDEQALALEGIGEYHLHTGDTQAAAAHLTQALDIFRHLAMTPDADRVQARLADLANRA